MNILTKYACTALSVAALAAPVIAAPVSTADTRITIGGTRVGIIPEGADHDKWLEAQLRIGANWVPDAASVELVDYPASAGSLTQDIPMDESVQIGAVEGIDAVLGQISAGSGLVSVIGVSQGALVAERMLESWATDPLAPSPSDVRFVLMGDPARGAFRLFDPGVVVGGLDVTVFRPTDSPYNVDVVTGEFDGFADPPDRFWNVFALANALLGIAYVHSSPLMVETHPGDAVLMSRVTNSVGGTTSTYLIPTPYLPLTQPLRDLGVDSAFVDSLDASLRPVITSAYTRYDAKAPAPAVATAPASEAPSVSAVRLSEPVSAAPASEETPDTAPMPDAAPILSAPAAVPGTSVIKPRSGEHLAGRRAGATPTQAAPASFGAKSSVVRPAAARSRGGD